MSKRFQIQNAKKNGWEEKNLKYNLGSVANLTSILNIEMAASGVHSAQAYPATDEISNSGEERVNRLPLNMSFTALGYWDQFLILQKKARLLGRSLYAPWGGAYCDSAR